MKRFLKKVEEFWVLGEGIFWQGKYLPRLGTGSTLDIFKKSMGTSVAGAEVQKESAKRRGWRRSEGQSQGVVSFAV